MQCAISTRSLERRFGDTVAVDGLNLDVHEAAVTGFLGPNGSGKTTTIRMLLGLLRPTAGSIKIFGLPMPGRRIDIVRQIGAMVETPCHYDHLTGRENLDLTRRLLDLARSSVDRVLAVTDLGRAEADRRVGGYSLGMRQRLGIARALLGDPRLLILDEPVNALDPEGIIAVRQLIRSLPAATGTTVLLSSHLLAEVEQTADRVALIGRGRILAQGALADILGGSAPRVVVASSNPAMAATFLRGHGFDVRDRDGPTLVVAGGAELSAAKVSRLLHDAGFELTQLREERPSLEQVYLGLTAGGQAAGKRP